MTSREIVRIPISVNKERKYQQIFQVAKAFNLNLTFPSDIVLVKWFCNLRRFGVWFSIFQPPNINFAFKSSHLFDFFEISKHWTLHFDVLLTFQWYGNFPQLSFCCKQLKSTDIWSQVVIALATSDKQMRCRAWQTLYWLTHVCLWKWHIAQIRIQSMTRFCLTCDILTDTFTLTLPLFLCRLPTWTN